MDFTRTMTIVAILLFGLLSFTIGQRIGNITAEPRCNDWLEKTKDLVKNIPDRINVSQIFIQKDKIILQGDYQISEFVDSNSMLPTLDYGSNGIQIDVDNTTKLYIGDIISYIPYGEDFTIVHRIVDIGEDDQGKYYITKGDNLPRTDIQKVRREQIVRVMVGVLW